jgi:hypothetical protein
MAILRVNTTPKTISVTLTPIEDQRQPSLPDPSLPL